MAKNVNFEKSAKNGKNRGFSYFFSNSDHSFIVIFFVKLEAYRGLILVKTVCSGHIRFFSYGLKRYRPIRLHGSSNFNREFRSRFSNADISGTKRAKRNPIEFY